MASSTSALRAVVVVPARDEQERIDRSLNALCHQRDIAAGSYEIVVVLDGCTDDTAAVVDDVAHRRLLPRVSSVVLPRPVGVGHARRIGMDMACRRLLAVSARDGLIASTDADSIVAPDWLVVQLELVGKGTEAIGGRIELDPIEQQLLDPRTLRLRDRAACERLRDVREHGCPGDTIQHHQFSAASLGITADAYVRCGGLPVRAALEDEALEHELKARGIGIHRSDRVRVTTSARVHGRAPRGLARDLATADWRARRAYEAADFTLERLLRRKRESIALVLPALEVAETIGPVIDVANRLREAGLLDEILVVDGDSADGTAEIAACHGVKVVQQDQLLAQFGPARGKGDAMWRGLAVTDSEIIAFADTDTVGFDQRFVLGLLGPMICEPQIQFVKGAFQRPFSTAEGVVADGGGRVTELMARPILNLHAPELAVFDQPLAGETVARRSLLEQLPFSTGYGVEIAMLIDVWRAVGLDAMCQVNLGTRRNRHQPLRDLSAMAYAVLVAAQSRFLNGEFGGAPAPASLLLPPRPGDDLPETRRVPLDERPPLATITGIGCQTPVGGIEVA